MVHCLTFTADKKRVITAGADRTVRVFEAGGGTQLNVMSGHGGEVKAMALAPGSTGWELQGLPQRGKNDEWDVSAVVTACEDGTSQLLNVNAGVTLKTFGSPSGGAIISTAFAPDGRLVALGRQRGGNIEVWDCVTGELVRELIGHTGAIKALTFTSSGRELLTASKDVSLAFDCGLVFRDPKAEMTWLTSDGDWQLSCRVWDLQEGASIASLNGHSREVSCLSYCKKSNRLATGSKDKTLRFW